MQVKRKELDAAAAAAADIDFHRAILAATKNHYFVAFHDFLSSQLAAERRLAWGAGGTDEAQLEHRELYDAIASQDDVSAALAAERHLRNAAQRMGIKLPDAGEHTA
jgi:GntR family transcriptional repressor for pyruvate dehydrogenase complex